MVISRAKFNTEIYKDYASQAVQKTPPAPSTATFDQVDHQLNLVWYALPKSTRHRILEQQREWLNRRDLLSAEDKIIETENRTTYLESLR
jgi:hypothetical protein